MGVETSFDVEAFIDVIPALAGMTVKRNIAEP